MLCSITHIYAVIVTHLSKKGILKAIQEFTLERSNISAANVTRLSQMIVLLNITWCYTLGKNHINAAIVTRLTNLGQNL